MAVNMDKISYIMENDPPLRVFIDIVDTMSVEEKNLLCKKIIEENELLYNNKK